MACFGGWPVTMRGDFDQQLIARLNSRGNEGDPCEFATPAFHGQALVQGPDDENWYERVQSAE
jgi:hypothetical protein